MPDGTGLPPGSGTAPQGAAIYAHKCAACHGPTGTEGPSERLVGREPRQGFPFGSDPRWVRTIGNYWPRSEEHTSELQSLTNLVCRLLLEKTKFLQLAALVANAPWAPGRPFST